MVGGRGGGGAADGSFARPFVLGPRSTSLQVAGDAGPYSVPLPPPLPRLSPSGLPHPWLWSMVFTVGAWPGRDAQLSVALGSSFALADVALVLEAVPHGAKPDHCGAAGASHAGDEHAPDEVAQAELDLMRATDKMEAAESVGDAMEAAKQLEQAAALGVRVRVRVLGLGLGLGLGRP